MIPKSCKRLAEVDFPIAEVSRHAAREKSIRHGHPSTLHLWWARRPLVSSRAVLMALLLPDPCDLRSVGLDAVPHLGEAGHYRLPVDADYAAVRETQSRHAGILTALEQVLGAAEVTARNGVAGVLEEDARLTAFFLWTLQSTGIGTDAASGDGAAENGDDETDDTPRGKSKGYSLIFDVVRPFRPTARHPPGGLGRPHRRDPQGRGAADGGRRAREAALRRRRRRYGGGVDGTRPERQRPAGPISRSGIRSQEEARPRPWREGPRRWRRGVADARRHPPPSTASTRRCSSRHRATAKRSATC